jgi:bla regulator protein blaR1
MPAFGESNFLQALGWAVLNSLWQMALLWIVYQLITGIFRSTSSAKKSVLASALLMTGFGWFVFTFVSIIYSEEAIATATIASIEGNEQLNEWLRRTLPVASVIYLILLILPLLHYIRNYRYVQVIRNHGLSKADVEWRMFVRRVAEQLGIKKPVHVWVSEFVTSPVTIGYLKPVILIPMAAINHLSTKQMEAVLLHELSHIRRYDYFINLILKFIQSILYFNPFVKAFVQIVEREREKSCDEMVIQFQYDPHGYASALLELEKNNHLPKLLAVAAAGKKHDLLHRIEYIMGVKKKSAISFNKVAAVFAGLLFIIGFNGMLIFSKPSANKQAPALADLSSPFYFFVNDNDRKAADIVNPLPELNREIIANHAAEEEKAATKERIAASKQQTAPAEHITVAAPTEPSLMYVTAFKPVVPVLGAKEVAQIEEALNVSKKVMKEGQWKIVEQKLAEVFTQTEKEVLKAELSNQISKLDMSKMEANLKLAYDNIDWPKVNAELNRVMSGFTLDSIQKAYNSALVEYNLIQKQLAENNMNSIPDTDITIETIEKQKQELQRSLNKLKSVRTKRTIHL